MKQLIADTKGFKCGEVLCLTATEYNVKCCLCPAKLGIEMFAAHFRRKHLRQKQSEEKNVQDERDPFEIFEINVKNEMNEELIIETDYPIQEDALICNKPVANKDVLLNDAVLNTVTLAKVTTSRMPQICIVDETGDNDVEKVANVHHSDDDSDHKDASENVDEDMPLIQLRKFRSRKCKAKFTSKNSLTKQHSATKLAVNDSEPTQQKPAHELNNSSTVSKGLLDISKIDLCSKARDIKQEQNTAKHSNDNIHNDNANEDHCSQNFDDDCQDNSEEDDEEDWNAPISKKRKNKFQTEALHDAEDDNDASDSKLSYKCKKCLQKFKGKKSLFAHIKTIHADSRAPRAPKKRNETYKCSFEGCSEGFPNEKMLENHKFKHTGIVCNICNKTFGTTAYLRTHLKRHANKRDVACKLCDYKTFTEQELRSHMVTHTGIEPHMCELCGKKCRHQGELKLHMRRHTGERPYKCNICDFSFFTGFALRQHMASHSSEYPFVCHCGAKSKTKRKLKVHQKIHETGEKFECNLCDRSFNKEKGLRYHIIIYHDANVLNSVINNSMQWKKKKEMKQLAATANAASAKESIPQQQAASTAQDQTTTTATAETQRFENDRFLAMMQELEQHKSYFQ